MSQTDGGAGRDRFETLAVHAGADPDPASGAVVPPIQLSTTFKQDGVGGTRDGYEYARTGNPTRRTLEAAIAALEGGTHGLAYASGMAAAQNVLYLVEPGERIVMSDDVYGGTWRLADRVWRRYGVEPVPVDLRDLDALAAVLAPGDDRRPVRMVWVETPTNPLLKIVDISAVVRLAAAAGAMTVVDNTFATPFLQRPLELGADLVLHSATKYLGGHSDVVGGLLATRRADLAEQPGLPPERRRCGAFAIRLLARPPRPAHPGAAHGAGISQRGAHRRLAHAPAGGCAGPLSGPSEPSAA